MTTIRPIHLLSLLFVLSSAACAASSEDDSESGAGAMAEGSEAQRDAREERRESAPREAPKSAAAAPKTIPAGWLAVTSKKCGSTAVPIATDERYLFDGSMVVNVIQLEDGATQRCNELRVSMRLVGSLQTSNDGVIETGSLVPQTNVTRCTQKSDESESDTPADPADTSMRGYRFEATAKSMRLTIEGSAECATGGALEIELAQ